ncbi:hypothetical protein [Streptacidiphilus anmyonensis]|uniref:hypothetical protein n=1 Tax=Streptacidiphilus anmyonensis TaxID=405782 RepID=UPI00128DC722|nr:hypothetical protein [Streptacidiphilus anmyonensis]
MKLRTTVATAVAATAAVLAVGAAPANAATAAKVNPQLSLSASTQNATYGQTITLTAHLGKTASNRTVSIYRSPVGEAANQVVKTGKVDSSGNLRVSLWMGRNTGFTVKFAGDAGDNAASRSVYVHDAAVVSASMVKADYSQSGWAYYHVGSQHFPTFAGKVSPNKANEPINIHLQVYYKGAWVNAYAAQAFQLDSSSSFGVYWKGLNAGWSWRVAATFNGDSTNSGSGYAWHYFKTVK